MSRVNGNRSSAMLRERAEKLLAQSPSDAPVLPTADVQTLIYELQVYQTELEMQNEELRLAQIELCQARDRYEELFDFAPVGYVTLDCDDRIEQANLAAAGMLGIERATLTATADFAKFVHPDSLAAWHTHQDLVFGGDVKQVCELALLRPDAKRLVVRVEGIVAGGASKDARRCLMALIDVTERKAAEEALQKMARELERSNEALKDFAMVASHDLQEPLRMVSGFMELLKVRYKARLDKEAGEYIEFAVGGAKRMSRMLSDLLTWSRVTTRGQQLAPAECKRAFEDACANLKVLIEENGAKVTAEPLPKVSADATQLMQVFQNLIENGIKFRDEQPPEVHVGVSRVGSEWQFSVSDNGIGIDPAQRERIFGVFRQLHARGRYAGTGMGLAICRKVVERHGGRIWAESKAGGGATICFTLPA
jgi:two-component system, chemotaxis family, sensor kinase Cph1